MESDLYKLCNVLTFYRQSLAGILNKIDEKIRHAISHYEETHTKDSSKKKYKISMQMIEVLQTHIKVLHAYENISGTLSSNLAQLEEDTQPEKENSYPNAFTSSSLIRAVKIEPNLSPEIDRSCGRENPLAGVLIEDDCSAQKQYQSTSPETREDPRVGALIRGGEVHRDGSTQSQCPAVVVNEQKIRFDNFIQELTDRSGESSDSTDSSSDTLQAENENVDYKENGIQAIVPEKECQVVENFEPEETTEDQDLCPIEELYAEEGAEPDKQFTPTIEYQSTDDLDAEELPKVPPVEEPCSNEGAKPKKQVTFNLAQASEPEPPRYDWRRETVKLFENRKLKVALRWRNSNGQMPLHPYDAREHQEERGCFVIEEDDLRVGQHCAVSHIESPSEFYVCTNRALLESFEEHINEAMNKHWHNVHNKFKSKVEARKHLGNFCFGYMWTRRKWYRVEVLNWMVEEPEKILVQLIDYGKKLCYSYTNLKKIADMLYSMFPKLSIRCHLAGIYSPHPSRAIWPRRSMDFFMELSEMTKRTKFEVIFVHRERNSYAVDLRKAADADADSLGELLIKNGHALEERDSEDDFLNTLDEKDLDEDEDECDSSDDSEGASSEQTGKVLPTNKMDLPLDGAIIEIVVIGYILDTCHFYVRILRNFSSGECFDDKFQRLVETMNTNNMVQDYEAFTPLPEIGDLALVKDGTMWCRGYCIKYTGDQDIEVFLVDFGYTVVEPLGHLRKMKEDFLDVPFQATECILSNCKEKKDVSEEMSLSFFNTVMKMKTFTARVIESAHDVMRLQMWDAEKLEMGKVLKTFGLGEDR